MIIRMQGDKQTESINKVSFILYNKPFANFWLDVSDYSEDKVMFVIRGNDELWNKYNRLIKNRAKYDSIHKCLNVEDVKRYESIVKMLKKKTNRFKSERRLLVD